MRFGKLLELDTSTQRQLFPRGSWAKPRRLFRALHRGACSPPLARRRPDTRTGHYNYQNARRLRPGPGEKKQLGETVRILVAGRQAGGPSGGADRHVHGPPDTTERHVSGTAGAGAGEPGSSLTEGRWKGANPAAGGGDNKQWTGMKKKCSKNLTT